MEEVVNIASGFVEGLVRSVTESDDTATGHQRSASGVTTDAIDWMGEVVKINCDGTVKVRLAREADPPPTWTGERYVIAKAEDLIVFEDDEDDEDGDEDLGYNTRFVDVWEGAHEQSEDEWEDASEGDMDVDNEIPEASLDGMDDESPSQDKAETQNVVTNGIAENIPSSLEVSQLGTESREWQIDREKYPAFDVLETVPDDHPFKSDNINANPGRDWLARIRSEHKILQSSLPGYFSSP